MVKAESWNAAEASKIIAAHADVPGALLPVLHALQDAFGYIDKAAVPLIADALNLSRAEVSGVISFYHDFRDSPPGRHVLKICRAEACQSMGSDALLDHLERRLHTELGTTTADKRVSLEAVYCLGNCACSPAVMLDGELFGRVDAPLIDRLIDGAGRRA